MATLHLSATATALPPCQPKPPPRSLLVRCGPRSNRTPVSSGRTLSSEAILAVQSLKRAHAPNSRSPPPDLTRLLKPDLVAALKELLRQDLCGPALLVLSVLRSEYPGTHPPGADLPEIYADVIFALSRCGDRGEDIDRLALELEEAGVLWEAAGKALARVVRGLLEAGRRDATVRVVEMMRRSGCGDTWTADSYLTRTLARGLRGMGEAELAVRVEADFGRVLDPKGSLENSPVA